MPTLTFLKKTEVTVTDERNTFRIVDDSLDHKAVFNAGDEIKGVNILDTASYTRDIELVNGDCIFGLPKDSIKITYI